MPGDLVWFDTGAGEQRGAVLGFVYSIPLEKGGPKEPALIVWHDKSTGHVYPHEVTRRDPIAA